MPAPEFSNYGVPCRSCQGLPSVNLGGLCVHCVEVIMEYHNQELVRTLKAVNRTLGILTFLSASALGGVLYLVATGVWGG